MNLRSSSGSPRPAAWPSGPANGLDKTELSQKSGYDRNEVATREIAMTIRLKVNGVDHALDVEPDAPLLWVIRDELGLTGTKFGCGIASCGACTVHVNGEATRSCVTPVSAVEGAEITTIEGVSANGPTAGAAGLDRSSGAAMRLLPVRHDHGRDGAAENQSQRRARPISSRRSPISAVAAPIRVSVPLCAALPRPAARLRGDHDADTQNDPLRWRRGGRRADRGLRAVAEPPARARRQAGRRERTNASSPTGSRSAPTTR